MPFSGKLAITTQVDMNPQDSSPTRATTFSSLFGDFQIGSNSRGQAYEAIPESPFTITTGNPVFANNGVLSSNHSPPASPPVNALASVSLRSPKCPQCKGKRFDFTSYFHNPRIFQYPPHKLLDVVERSYILKNRLHSLLVTYIVNDLRKDDRKQDARENILEWAHQVAKLAGEVGDGLIQDESIEAGLAAVQVWTRRMAKRLVDHLDRSKGLKMEALKGWRKEVLSEFRKHWENVWIACTHHQEISSDQGGSYQNHVSGSEQAGQLTSPSSLWNGT